jgi:hypothetical protein
MFLEPQTIGHSYGRMMWDHALTTAHDLGFQRLTRRSDSESA